MSGTSTINNFDGKLITDLARVNLMVKRKSSINITTCRFERNGLFSTQIRVQTKA